MTSAALTTGDDKILKKSDSMRTKIICFILLTAGFVITGCKNDKIIYVPISERIELAQNYVPYKTEKYLRICYMLKTWEFEKEGLKLNRIVVFDSDTKVDIFTIEKADLPFIHKDPLPQSPEFKVDKIDKYYLSLQVPVLLGHNVPANISHRFILTDTIHGKEVTVEGGKLQPRKNDLPRMITLPVKGNYYLFHNQSTLGYHYYLAFFINGQIYTNEKFAFDLTQLNEMWKDTYSGDPKKNESYFAYGDTLYAVASGTVVKVVNGRPENSGNARDVPLNISDEYYGNYLILDIGGGCYADYMHCKPNSFLVEPGAVVTEGQPIARLGNSGNSTEPHLHFQLVDNPDPGFCHGLPFVFNKYTKIGEIIFSPVPGPIQISPIMGVNSNMENWSVARSN